MKQNYKIYLCALLLVGAAGMMTAGAQVAPKLAVFVVGMDNTLGDKLATQIGSELNRNSRYTVLSSATDPVKTKLTELRSQSAGSIDRNALAAWGRDNGVSTICLVVDDVKGNDNLFSAHLIDARESKVSGRGSYIRTGVVEGDLPRVSLALSRQLDGPERVARKDVTPQQKWFEPEMVQIEGATSVTLGWRSTDGSSSSNNVKAAYTASVSNFKIGKYMVTQAQWCAVMTGTKFENYFYWGGSRGTANGALNSANCGNVACDDQRPVEYISWYLALAFCNKLSEMSGKQPVYGGFTLADIADNGDCSACSVGANVTVNANANGYRLPTQNEWEYAARGCKAGVCENFMYSGSDNLQEVGWNGTTDGAAFANGATHPVGQLKPNGLGIYDMSGNLWEWCYDLYSGSERAMRGGPWRDAVVAGGLGWGRLAARGSRLPSACDNIVGFRVALP